MSPLQMDKEVHQHLRHDSVDNKVRLMLQQEMRDIMIIVIVIVEEGV